MEHPSQDFDFYVEFDIFKDYFLCKAFDVFGNGSYKPYMIKCKDNHDPWAVCMHRSVSAVNECIRQLNVLFQRMDLLPNQFLSVVAKDVLHTTSPPSCGEKQWGVCGISGQHTNECVNIVTGGRGAEVLSIHTKYFTFFKYFWFVLKFDHVIRSVIKYWISQNENKLSGMTKTGQCEYFTQNYCFKKHHIVFNAAIKHVSQSLLIYMRHYESISPMQLLIQSKEEQKKQKKRKL